MNFGAKTTTISGCHFECKQHISVPRYCSLSATVAEHSKELFVLSNKSNLIQGRIKNNRYRPEVKSIITYLPLEILLK